jgi:hypothetical protein
MYTNKKSYYKPPAAKKEASAEDVMTALDSTKPTGEQPVDSGLAVPPPGGEIPGLPPAPGELPPPAPDAAPMTPPPAAPAVPPPPAS